MQKMQMFESPEFGQVRTLTENGEVLFCGLDVAQALGYARPHDALKRHCRYSVKRRVPHPQAADKQIEMLYIPEPDLYRLIFGSKLPTAEKFTDWVTKDILPAIRKSGVYMTDEALEAAILNPDTIIKLALELKAESNMRQDLERQIMADAPKVALAEAIITSPDSILIGDLAKILCQNGVDIGQHRLFEWLRENGYLCKCRGESRNMPTQKAMEMGLFELKETTVIHNSGLTMVMKTPKVTGLGQQFFVNLFLGA